MGQGHFVEQKQPANNFMEKLIVIWRKLVHAAILFNASAIAGGLSIKSQNYSAVPVEVRKGPDIGLNIFLGLFRTNSCTWAVKVKQRRYKKQDRRGSLAYAVLRNPNLDGSHWKQSATNQLRVFIIQPWSTHVSFQEFNRVLKLFKIIFSGPSRRGAWQVYDKNKWEINANLRVWPS